MQNNIDQDGKLSMVKPSNARYSFVFIVFAILLMLIFVVSEIFTIHNSLQLANDPSACISITIALIATFVIPSIIMFTIVNQGSRYNRRRQAAARREPAAVIYPQQPIANVQEYALPMTITLYPKAQMGIGMALVAGLCLACALAGIWIQIMPNRIWSVILGIVCLTLIVWLMIWTFRQPIIKITLTEKEIQIKQFDEERAIAWTDARLFSVFAVRRQGNNVYYELSSAKRILRWNWDRSLRGLRPTTSQEEYNRQMEAVLRIIAAKTGLPLYDLRGIPTYGMFLPFLFRMLYYLVLVFSSCG